MAIKAKNLEKVLLADGKKLIDELADGKKLIDELEKDIDEYLIKHDTGDSPVTYVPNRPLNYYVQNRIINLYNDAGWHVKYVSNERNGFYLVFTPWTNLTCSICGGVDYHNCNCWGDSMGS